MSVSVAEELLDTIKLRLDGWDLFGVDPFPGTPWSKSFNDSGFLLALQKVKHDEWLNDENRGCWQFLHVGSEEPN